MTQKYRIPDDVVSETVDGEAVVLNLASGKYFALNDSGTRMWALLARHGAPEAVVSDLLEEFEGVDAAIVRSDLDAFISELLDRGLLEQRSG